jgi:hypothetical protein
MKNFFTISFLHFLFFFSFQATCQDVDWLWATNVGGPELDQGKCVAIDAKGDILLAGIFKGSITFGSTTLTATNYYHDVFVAKYDKSGAVLWAISFGGCSADYVEGLTVDDDLNIYLSGSFNDSISIENQTFKSAGSDDYYVIKLNQSGQLVWAKTFGGKMSDKACGISVDNLSVYVGGSFWGSCYAGTDSVTSAGVCDMFVQKLDTAGNSIWIKSAGGKLSDYPKGISANNGMAYICGQFSDTCNFQTHQLVGQKSTDVFCAAISSSGHFVWAKSGLGDYGNYPNAMTSDNDGNVYLTGCFGKNISFDKISLSSTGLVDIFVVKYDSLGSCKWAIKAGGSSYDQGCGIYADDKNNLVLTGFFNGSMNIGSKSLISHGGNDIFVASLNKSGSFEWALNAGGTSWDFGLDVCRGKDAVYSTGYFSTSANFGTIQLNAAGTDADIYIAKIAVPPPPSVFITKQPTAVTSCKGDSIAFYISATGSNLQYQWEANTIEIAGETDSILIISDIQETDAAWYTCKVYDSAYSVKSNPAELHVNLPPQITTHPKDVTVGKNKTTTLNVVVAHGKSYQWQKNGVNLPGEKNMILMIKNAQESDTGEYRCIVYGDCGSDTSNMARVMVSTVGLKNLITDNVRIFPNPTSGICMIRSESLQGCVVQIYNTNGALILNKVCENNFLMLDLSAYESGLYLLKLNQNHQVLTKSLIIQ